MSLTYGSLFAGVGGFDQGFDRANGVVASCSEWIGKRIVGINRIRPEDATLLGLEN